MPAWGISFRFSGSVIAAAVAVQFSLFRYLRYFHQILFDFLDNFIFVFYYLKNFIIAVCLFITFLQALVHWCAYESCFVV